MTDGEEYESELTKMAETQTERGVNEISKGERNLDDEFKKDGTRNSRASGGAMSTARKSNKKSGSKKSKAKRKKSKRK